MSIKGKAYIAGIYEHPTRLATDNSLAQLHAEVAKGALEDAGLTKDDVDGYFCAGDAPGLGPMSMVDYMGLKPRHVDSTDTGGSSYLIHVGHAAEAIAAGKCKVALITLAGRPRAEGMATGTVPRSPRRHADAGRPVRVPLRADGREHVRDVRHAPHARVRHHHRAARLDQGRGLAPRAAQPACAAARRGHGRGGGELADDLRSAAPARLLRHHRRRRRDRRRGAGDRRQAQAAQGQADRRRRGREDPDGRQGRPDLFRRALQRRDGLRRGGREARPTSSTPRSTTASPSPC